MKAGLSLLFVDFDEYEAAMKSCLQGSTSKPRVNPSRLVGITWNEFKNQTQEVWTFITGNGLPS